MIDNHECNPATLFDTSVSTILVNEVKQRCFSSSLQRTPLFIGLTKLAKIKLLHEAPVVVRLETFHIFCIMKLNAFFLAAFSSLCLSSGKDKEDSSISGPPSAQAVASTRERD